MADNAEEMPTWNDPPTDPEWQCRLPGATSWYEALGKAKSLRLNGKSDWRLPMAAELENLIDRKTLYGRMRPITQEMSGSRPTQVGF